MRGRNSGILRDTSHADAADRRRNGHTKGWLQGEKREENSRTQRESERETDSEHERER